MRLHTNRTLLNLLYLIPICGILLLSQPADSAGCRDATPTAAAGRIAPEEEPGAPMKVRGRVIEVGGELASGVTVYAYQADSAGEYHRDDSGEARLCGIVKTDSLGQYQFQTIRPGSYPGTNIPAHIHFVVWSDSIKEQMFTLEFGEEHEFTAEYRARFGPSSSRQERTATVRPLALDAAGVWHCARDLQLE